jgi:hypothetical protein
VKLYGSGHSVEDDRLKRADLYGLAATGIPAPQLVVQPYSIVPRLGEPCAVPFVGPTGELGFSGAPPPLDGIFGSGPAFGTVDLGRHDFILFIKQVAFFHRLHYVVSGARVSRNFMEISSLWY